MTMLTLKGSISMDDAEKIVLQDVQAKLSEFNRDDLEEEMDDFLADNQDKFHNDDEMDYFLDYVLKEARKLSEGNYITEYNLDCIYTDKKDLFSSYDYEAELDLDLDELLEEWLKEREIKEEDVGN